MPVSFTDSTASTQLLAASNSGNVELGANTPTSSLTIAGRQLMNGSILANGVLPSGGLNRITGVISLTQGSTTTISSGSLAGVGTVSGGYIISFDLAGATFDATCGNKASGNYPYSVI